MVTINVKDHLTKCASNDDGKVIYDLLNPIFERGEKATVSFKGIPHIASSFVNSAFIEFLARYDFNFIRTNLGFSDTNKHINETIKRRFSFETSKIERSH
jgi:hypothetical protein